MEPGSLAFSVTLYSCCAIITIAFLFVRRISGYFGNTELGGPRTPSLISGFFLIGLWFFYATMSTLQVYGIITGFWKNIFKKIRIIFLRYFNLLKKNYQLGIWFENITAKFVLFDIKNELETLILKSTIALFKKFNEAFIGQIDFFVLPTKLSPVKIIINFCF